MVEALVVAGNIPQEEESKAAVPQELDIKKV